MRIALVSDLHGNEVALRAVLADIDRVGVDQVICLGDVATLGPAPHAVIALLQERDCPCILGNHDAFMLDAALIRSYSEVGVIVEAVDRCRESLTADELDFLGGFAADIQLELDATSSLYLFHGTPRSHMEDLLVTTPPDEVDAMLDGHSATLMAGGHTHIQMLRQHRGSLIVNPGSVGAPFREYVAGAVPTLMNHAEYATVEAEAGRVAVHLHRVPLDAHALLASVKDWDSPLRDAMAEHYASLI